MIGVATWGARRLINAISGSDAQVLAMYDVFTSGSIFADVNNNLVNWNDCRGSGFGPTINITPNGHPKFDQVQMVVSHSGSGLSIRSATSALLTPVLTCSVIAFGSATANGNNGTNAVALGDSTTGLSTLGVGCAARSGTLSTSNTNTAEACSTISGSAIVLRTMIGSLGPLLTMGYDPPTLAPVNIITVTPFNTPLNGAITLGNYFAGASIANGNVGMERGCLVIAHTASAGEVSSLAQFGSARYGCTGSG